MKRAAALLVLLGAVAPTTRAQTPLSRDTATTPRAATGNATIRGRVLVAGTDVPVRKARIILTPDAGSPLDPIYADNDGRFAATTLVAGRYTVAAWKSGYVDTKFGARGFWDRHVSVVAVLGAAAGEVTLMLEKGAAISGRVLDESGDPLIGAIVRVGRVRTIKGEARFESGDFVAQTDDLGEYRIGGLPAGTFVVAAFGFPLPSSVAPGSDPRTSAMLRRPHAVYHPRALQILAARPVALKSGEEATAVDVTFAPETVAPRISGRIIDSTGRGGPFVLSIGSDGDGVPDAASTINSSVSADGEFSMSVPPGEYTLVARSPTGLIAVQHATVRDTDVSGVQLVLAKGARVSGRVVFRGATPRPPGRFLVEARPTEYLGGLAVITDALVRELDQPARTAVDGSFTLSGIVGRRLLQVPRPPDGRAVTAITVGDRSLLDVPIDFKGDEDLRDVIIVLSDRCPPLSGTVVDDQAKAAVGVSVLVFPEDKRLLPARARWVRVDTSGRFTVDDLPPGDYLVALAGDVDELHWSTAEYLDQYRARASRTKLVEGEGQPLALRWSQP